jgi:hypothetical protein
MLNLLVNYSCSDGRNFVVLALTRGRTGSPRHVFTHRHYTAVCADWGLAGIKSPP